MIRTYEVNFEGKHIFVDADVKGTKTRIYSIRHLGKRDPETHEGEAVPDPDHPGKECHVALGAWSAERTRALAALVVRAERIRVAALSS